MMNMHPCWCCFEYSSLLAFSLAFSFDLHRIQIYETSIWCFHAQRGTEVACKHNNCSSVACLFFVCPPFSPPSFPPSPFICHSFLTRSSYSHLTPVYKSHIIYSAISIFAFLFSFIGTAYYFMIQTWLRCFTALCFLSSDCMVYTRVNQQRWITLRRSSEKCSGLPAY